MEMMNRSLREPQPRVLEALDHLHANHPAGRVQPYAIVTGAPNQTEITIHILDFYRECELYDPTISLADNLPVKRVRPADLETVNHVYAVFH